MPFYPYHTRIARNVTTAQGRYMCKTILLKYRGVCPTLVVVVGLWIIAIATGIAIGIPPGNVMQACATILVGGLIPVLYYHLITRPAERGSALKKTTIEELGSVVEDLGKLSTELQLILERSDYDRIRKLGYEIACLETRIHAVMVLVGGISDIGDQASKYLEAIVSGITRLRKVMLDFLSLEEHEPIQFGPDVLRAMMIVHYNHLAYVMCLHGSTQDPISMEDYEEREASAS